MSAFSFEIVYIYMLVLNNVINKWIKNKITNLVGFCLKACSSSFYGIGCTEKCGHCTDVNHCDYINGTCSTGCSAGYLGDLCKSRE